MIIKKTITEELFGELYDAVRRAGRVEALTDLPLRDDALSSRLRPTHSSFSFSSSFVYESDDLEVLHLLHACVMEVAPDFGVAIAPWMLHLAFPGDAEDEAIKEDGDDSFVGIVGLTDCEGGGTLLSDREYDAVNRARGVLLYSSEKIERIEKPVRAGLKAYLRFKIFEKVLSSAKMVSLVAREVPYAEAAWNFGGVNKDPVELLGRSFVEYLSGAGEFSSVDELKQLHEALDYACMPEGQHLSACEFVSLMRGAGVLETTEEARGLRWVRACSRRFTSFVSRTTDGKTSWGIRTSPRLL